MMKLSLLLSKMLSVLQLGTERIQFRVFMVSLYYFYMLSVTHTKIILGKRTAQPQESGDCLDALVPAYLLPSPGHLTDVVLRTPAFIPP